MAQTKKTQPPTNPATAFLRMAGFNMLVAILFIVFYFFYHGSDGERSVLILVAGLIAFFAAIMSVVAYSIFAKKFEKAKKKKR